MMETISASENIERADEQKVRKVIAKAEGYWNPYLAGIGLGIVLLLAYVIMGRGLGASGAFSSLVTVGVQSVAPEHAKTNEFYSEYTGDGSKSPLKDWLVFEVIGVLTGGLVSGALAGRIKLSTDKGPRTTTPKRLMFALMGGIIMGIGAKLARGCTSGQALTGGAVLNLGSWAFMFAVFAGGYAVAYFVRRQWI